MPASLPSGWRIEDSPRSACHGRLLDAEGTPLADLYVDPSVPPARWTITPLTPPDTTHRRHPPLDIDRARWPNAWRRYGCHQESQEKLDISSAPVVGTYLHGLSMHLPEHSENTIQNF